MGFQELEKKFSESRWSSRRFVLRVEAVLTLILLALDFYTFGGTLYPLFFVPLLATIAYFKGLKRASLLSLASVIIAPIIAAILSTAILLILFSTVWTTAEVSGMVLLLIPIAAGLAAVVAPYAILGAATGLHLYKRRTGREKYGRSGLVIAAFLGVIGGILVLLLLFAASSLIESVVQILLSLIRAPPIVP